MKKQIVLLLAGLVLGASAQAATQALDTAASSIAWKGTKKIGKFHNGHVGVKGGSLDFGKKGELTGGMVIVDMKTISNEDLKNDPDSQKKLVGHLSSADFFDVEKYPESTFKVTQVKMTGKDSATVKGDFTMIGKTQPVEFPVKMKTENGVTTADALVKIDRTKWDLKYGSGNFFKTLTADKIINDEIEFNVKLVTKK